MLTPTITLNNLGKKFGKEWVFRKLSYEIVPNQKLLILGGNGSGKSTLLQVISGFVTPNEGRVEVFLDYARNDIDYARNDIDYARNDIDSLRHDNDSLRNDIDSLRHDNDSARNDAERSPIAIGTGRAHGNDNHKINPDKLRNYISFASPYLQLIEDFTLLEMIEHTRLFKPFLNSISSNEVIELIQLQSAKNKFIRQFSSGMKQRLKLGLAILADTPILLLDEPISNLDKNAIQWYKDLIAGYTVNRTVVVCSNAIADEHFFCNTELNVVDYKIQTIRKT
ncbi:hypothetical protein CNR22_11895 [Sphingobacteriaceae bacterium]|nr:hypothetical protein CNR22_11895 [Sphingobacteriaceae bacterium]